MVRKMYVRYKEDLPESEMMFSAQEGFRQRGIETTPFYGFGDLFEVRDFSTEVGVMGYIGDVWDALAVLGLKRPDPLDYPDDLGWALQRNIWTSTIQEVINECPFNVFIKPVNHKLFTGFVSDGTFSCAIKLSPYEKDEKVWVSEVVDILSEYRCFILNKKVIDVRRYKGDWSVFPSKSFITDAVAVWKDQPVAWTLDVGVTKDMKNVLIEVNDGYSFGSYGLPSIDYSKMIEARWQELAAVK